MSIDRARAAVAQGQWQAALGALDDMGDAGRTPVGLELRAQASYGNGQLEATISAWEALHALLVSAGDRVGAARAAVMIAMYLLMDTGLMAPVRGWLRRTERLLEGEGETPVHALLAMVHGYERVFAGDLDAAAPAARQAIELGTRHDVNPAVVLGRTATARIHILRGEVDEGLAQLDDVATLLMSGGADPLTTGMMYCELVCAAQGLALYERASEWTDVMEHWRHGEAIGGINGRCRVHRAELLRMSGPCADAEREALGACDELRPWMRREFGWPLAELGNVLLRKGDLAGAEDAFLAAHGHAWSPQPGLALVRLAQGDAARAAALIADAIEHPLDMPWKERPPFGELRLAPLYEAQAEIAASIGDRDTVGRAAEALASIAAKFHSPALVAGASLAAARRALLDGDAESATRACAGVIATWADIGAPYECAMARVVLGAAHQQAGRTDLAHMEWQAAKAAFESYGAPGKAAEAAALLDGRASAATVHGDVATAAFTRDGDLRTMTFGGTTVVMRDLVGLRYVARLLADPGREVHVRDLVAVEQGSASMSEGGLPMLDEQARESYRRRLAEVDEDIEEATAANDLGRVDRAERDREYLIAELSRAAGLGGKERTTGSSAERARTSVTRSIRYALDQVARQHTVLGAHLGRSVRTGTYCAYEPDPSSPVDWRVE
ncbi:MAG TPA: hypothetical protein VMS14_03920 [Ilumatobacteraceae bacterium]|nr:hypothetical protein [Ilumatobacteraceae bacterium]